MQEPEGQSPKVHAAEGAQLSGGSVPEQLEVEASPLMRWTSDGSMMEELLRTFSCAPACIPLAALSAFTPLACSGQMITTFQRSPCAPSARLLCSGPGRLQWRQPQQ